MPHPRFRERRVRARAAGGDRARRWTDPVTGEVDQELRSRSTEKSELELRSSNRGAAPRAVVRFAGPQVHFTSRLQATRCRTSTAFTPGPQRFTLDLERGQEAGGCRQPPSHRTSERALALLVRLLRRLRGPGPCRRVLDDQVPAVHRDDGLRRRRALPLMSRVVDDRQLGAVPRRLRRGRRSASPPLRPGCWFLLSRAVELVGRRHLSPACAVRSTVSVVASCVIVQSMPQNPPPPPPPRRRPRPPPPPPPPAAAAFGSALQRPLAREVRLALRREAGGEEHHGCCHHVRLLVRRIWISSIVSRRPARARRYAAALSIRMTESWQLRRRGPASDDRERPWRTATQKQARPRLCRCHRACRTSAERRADLALLVVGLRSSSDAAVAAGAASSSTTSLPPSIESTVASPCRRSGPCVVIDELAAIPRRLGATSVGPPPRPAPCSCSRCRRACTTSLIGAGF